MRKRWKLLLTAAVLLLVSGVEAGARGAGDPRQSVSPRQSVPPRQIVLWSSQGPVVVEREAHVSAVAADGGPVDPESLVRALVDGPTPQERSEGFWTAVPQGTEVAAVLEPSERTVVVRLEVPASELEHLDHERFEVLVEQVGGTLAPTDWGDLRIQVRDPESGDFVALADFLPEIEVPAKPSSDGDGGSGAAAVEGGQPGAPGQGQPAGALSGKTVYVSAGHGWEWNSYRDQWRTQRPPYPSGDYDGPIIEDHNNAEAVNQYLLHYLWNAGAQVWPVRERDMNSDETIVDDPDAACSGSWASIESGYGGHSREADTVTGEPTAATTWSASLAADGRYAVYVWYEAKAGRATDARYIVHHAGGETTVRVNQQQDGYTWRYIGTYGFLAGGEARVTLTNKSDVAGRTVAADAVRFGGGTFDSLGGIDTVADGPPHKPWWEVASYYYTQKMGMPAPYGDVTARPTYARWEQSDSEGPAVYVSWHTNGATGHQWSYSGTETYAHNGEGLARTEGSLELRHALHSEVVRDIRAGWDSSWVDRGEKTRNLGELRLLWDDDASKRMPGALLEIGFHDHPGDTDALKEPRFNQLVARAVYQGIVKYFDSNGVLLPEPPTHPAVANIGGGSVRVSWEPSPTDGVGLRGDAATGYRVYTSRNGIGWSNGVSVGSGTEHVISGLSAGELLFVRVTATNAGGESFPTETLAVRVGDTAEVLIVNGFDRLNETMCVCENDPTEGLNMRMLLDRMNRYDYVIQHAEAIRDAAHLAFDSASNEAVRDGAVNLNNYTIVDWILGEESTDDETLDAAERSLLQAFLSEDGALFISGSEIGYHLSPADPSFYGGRLRAAYLGDNAGTYEVEGRSGDFWGLQFRFDAPGMYNADYPDHIGPVNGSEEALRYRGGCGGTAAVQYENPHNECERLVYFGFPFETIRADQRGDVMSAVLGFLGQCLNPTVDTAIGSPAYDSAHRELPIVSGSAHVEHATLDRVEVQLQDATNGTYWNGTSWGSTEAWVLATGGSSWSYDLPMSLPESKYRLRARGRTTGELRDGTPAEVTFTYDRTPPEATTLISPTGGVEIAALPELMLNWTEVVPDGGSDLTYRVMLDGEVFATSSPFYTTPHVGDGTHEWQVEVRDEAGNSSGWTQPETFSIRRQHTWLPAALQASDGQPPSCRNLVINGGFELNSGWYFNNATYDASRPHSGQRSALVGYDSRSYSSVRQTVVIPEGSRATLRLWVYPMNENQDPDDLQYVWLWDESSADHPLELTTSDAKSWRQGEYDLTDFMGERVTIIVGATNDGDGNLTRVYVDDVELEVCP